MRERDWSADAAVCERAKLTVVGPLATIATRSDYIDKSVEGWPTALAARAELAAENAVLRAKVAAMGVASR